MKNIVSIYEFQLPFISTNNTHTRYAVIREDVRKMLLYNNLYISHKSEKHGNYDITEFDFQDGIIKIIYNEDIKNYFIPNFQLDIYSDTILVQEFFEELSCIFYSIDYQDYIFDFISDNIQIHTAKILTLKNLQKAFSRYNYQKLSKIIQNTPKEYLDDTLRENMEIRNSILYLIYTCYNLYKNIIISQEGKQDLQNILGKTGDDTYFSHILLFETRISQVKDINMQTFLKYKQLLDHLFHIVS